MPNEHARLAPSAAERWLECPASVRMEGLVPEQEDSVYAAEGTCAHELSEIKARYAFGQISQARYHKRVKEWHRTWAVNETTFEEMDEHTDAYVDLLKERQQLYPGTQVLIEQRLNTGVPACWGTSDAVLVSPVHVEVVDFKYGSGVEVQAQGNPQLRLYLCGALDTYGDLLGDTEVVRVTVHQPRMYHTLTEELTPAELREWRTSIIPIAELALSDDAPFGPSETACRWCPASGRCQAQVEKVFEDIDFDVTPDLLDEEDLAELLKKVGFMRDWLNALEDTALHRAYSEGKTIPGYKVVLSGGKRSILNPDEAIEYMIKELGYAEEQVARRSPRTLGDLELLMGAQVFAQKMKDFIKPPTGKPSLVPESDKRPSVQPNTEAVKDFAMEDLI